MRPGDGVHVLFAGQIARLGLVRRVMPREGCPDPWLDLVVVTDQLDGEGRQHLVSLYNVAYRGNTASTKFAAPNPIASWDYPQGAALSFGPVELSAIREV